MGNKTSDLLIENKMLNERISLLEAEKATLEKSVVNYATIANTVKERVKELECMYHVARLIVQQKNSCNLFRKMVEVIPLGWQFPKKAGCYMKINDSIYESKYNNNTVWKQSVDILIDNETCGYIEVNYSEDLPFLKDESHLIEAIARIISLYLKHEIDEEQNIIIQQQLYHADRLVTIGQLSSGIAHELNEPLGNILGFAQLAAKQADIPEIVMSDLKKIEKATLHSREIIKKLMAFCRQTPSEKSIVNLNSTIEENIYIFESRCTKENVNLIKNFSKEPLFILADPNQINQIITNLMVNALQAMPDGGNLIIGTMLFNGKISINIHDSGKGIEKKNISKLFLPFFTTKDVNEGTGLGLSVVYGIVKSHNGEIKVSSELNKGTEFIITFPQVDKN